MTTARSQNLTAFAGWVSDLARLHTRALSRVARAEGLSAADALDAVQAAFETFLELPEARTLVGRDQDSRRLLSTVVRNVARNMRRRAFRRLPHKELGVYGREWFVETSGLQAGRLDSSVGSELGPGPS
jgi:DNA-directed RNA polymerase specialized sigma24 family protein